MSIILQKGMTERFFSPRNVHFLQRKVYILPRNVHFYHGTFTFTTERLLLSTERLPRNMEWHFYHGPLIFVTERSLFTM